MRTEYTPPSTALAVKIVLSGGMTIAGKLLARLGRNLADTLNGPQTFLEFEAYSGERSYIAKTQVVSLTILETPPNPRLQVAAIAGDFDPYSVLGVAPGASHDKLRQAYVRVAKKYHPDRFAGIELPAEVVEYLGAMTRRVNAAYAALSDQGSAVPEGER